MPDLKQRRCRGKTCRAPIVLAPTINGRWMPLDATPDPEGNVVLGVDLFGDPVATVIGTGAARDNARDAGVDLYMPHHASCPAVEEFRP